MPSLDFLIWLQQFRSGFTDALFVGASALGAEEAYMALLTAIYLCVGHRFGFHLFVMFLASAYSNSQLKALADTHRPFLLHPQLNPLYPGSAEGQSFPSGHAQNAAVVWGIIAIRQRSARVRVAIIALVLLIALSRLYLQVHWPVDVIGGLASGLLLVLIYLIAVGVWASRQCDPGRVAWALVIVIGSALMFLFGYHEATCVRSTGALLGSGLGYSFVLIAMALIREPLGFGTLMGVRIMPAGFVTWQLMVLPPGAFITLGLLMGGVNWFLARRQTARG